MRTSIRWVGSSVVGQRGGRGDELPIEADVGGIEPADDRFEPKSSASATSANGTSSSPALGLDPGVALHDLDHVPAVHLQDLVDVDPGICRATSTLITSSSRGGRHKLGRRRSQSASSCAGGGDPVALPARPPHRPSTSPSRSRRPNVVYTCPELERPHLARPCPPPNSLCNRSPYFGPSLSRASSA